MSPTFPSGVQTVEIVFGKGIAPNGEPQAATLAVYVIYGGQTQAAIWDGDGTAMLPLSFGASAPAGQLGSIRVPVTDQSGWLDDSGNGYSGWAYRLVETVGKKSRERFVQPMTGQTLIDFDRIPTGNVGLPLVAPMVPVTSVNGVSGAVTVINATPENIEAGLPTRLTTAAILAITDGIAARAPLASPAFTGTPTGITKGHVGLGNVDNTSDVNKPISSATQTALDAKAPLASPAFTGTPTGITKGHVGLGNVDNTSDVNKPVSSAAQTALDAKTAKDTLVYLAVDHGMVADANTATATTNGNALRALITAIAATTSTQYDTNVTIVFPAGRMYLAGVFVIPSGKRINLQGGGRYNTILQRPSGESGDFFTINEQSVKISDLSLEGGKYQNVGGPAMDLLVLNSAYPMIRNVGLNKATGDSLVLGKSGGAAIGGEFQNIQVREPLGYGINIYAGSGSTDNMWVDLDIAYTGLSGIYIGTGSQNMINPHVWGCGTLEVTGDNHGFKIVSGGNVFANIQPEKNNGNGVYTTSDNNEFTGGRIWANGLGAVRGIGSNKNSLVGVGIYRNSVKNSGSNSISFAAIYLSSSSYWRIVGCGVYDDTAAIAASGSAPTAPTGGANWPGKPAAIGTSFAYAEDSSCDFNVVVGNSMRKETTLGSGVPYSIVGNSDRIEANDFGASLALPSATPVETPASSGNYTVRIPMASDIVIVGGNYNLTNIVGHRAGRRVTILFSGTGGLVTDGGTLKLVGNLSPASGVTLTLFSDGTNWYETARSTT